MYLVGVEVAAEEPKRLVHSVVAFLGAEAEVASSYPLDCVVVTHVDPHPCVGVLVGACDLMVEH